MTTPLQKAKAHRLSDEQIKAELITLFGDLEFSHAVTMAHRTWRSTASKADTQRSFARHFGGESIAHQALSGDFK